MIESNAHDALKEMVQSIAVDIFNEEANEINEETRIGYKRAEFELIAEELPETKEWQIHLNNKVRIPKNHLGVYQTKEEAKEVMKVLLTAYHFGFIEGIEKGQQFGMEGYPDGMSFAIGFQEFDETNGTTK